MNTENMINITGVSLEEVVRHSYDLSRPQGMGYLHYTEGGLTTEEIKKLVDYDHPRVPVSMNYVKGRAVKLTVFKDGDQIFIRDIWFDHSEHDLKELLNRLGVEEHVND